MHMNARTLPLALAYLLTVAVACVAAAPPAPADAESVGPAAEAELSEEVVHYAVNLDELPGAQVYVQTGARTADGGCTFTGGGTGQANGHGRVLVITELSFDPKTCVRELAQAEYAREALPASVAAKVELPASSDTTQRDSQQILTPGGPATEETQAFAVVEYLGSLKVNFEDPPQIDVTTTKSSLRWSNTGSRLNTSYHNAHWNWYSPSGWRRSNASWSYDNNGSRAYTDTYGRYYNAPFCTIVTQRPAPPTWTEHLKTYFEGRPYGAWSWSYNVRKWGGCNGLLHYEHIVETP